MYAQLCKRLSEEAPNSEPPGQPCTFKVLLLNKCRDEFENRAQAFAAYERGGAPLSPDDEERRHIAKCKMLGNIKFIGELGKLEILSEAILHRCIQALLARRAGGEAADDLECLAQLVRTCGRVLDSARGRGLMEQYFARIAALSEARHLAPRIRFMLRDTVELRRHGWVPRAAAASDPPVPIHQLRPEDGAPPPAPPPDPLFRRARPLDDVLAGLALSSPDHPTPPDKLFGNGFGSRNNRNNAPSQFSRGGGGFGGGGGGKGGANKEPAPRLARSRLAPAPPLADVQMRPAANSLLFTANKLSNKQTQPTPLQPVPQSMMNSGGFSSGGAPLVKEPAITIKPADKKDKPKKDKGMSAEEAAAAGGAAGAGACAGGAAAALQALAPLPDKLLRRALAAALLHCFHHAHEEDVENSNGVAESESAPSEQKETPAPSESAAPASPAPPASPALSAPPALPESGGAGEGADEGEGVEAEDLAAAEALRGGAEAARAACARGVVALVRAARRAPLPDLVRALLPRHPHPALPHLLAQAVLQKLITVSELGAWAAEGSQWELIVDVLAAARAEIGLRALGALLEEARAPLPALLRAAGASDTDAAAATRSRKLHALAPVLHLQAELSRCLEGSGEAGSGGEAGAEASPAALWRWVRGVEAAARAHPAFVGALVQHVAAHVTRRADTLAPAPPRHALDAEAALAEAFAPLLGALTRGRADAQLAAVYALQLHAHALRYPRGLLLRWFMYLYNLEVCEEDAFLRWREDVTDEYPGKGEALFQVNAWLTWLQQQESEEEEGED